MIIDVHCHYTFTARRAAVSQRFSFEPLADEADMDSMIAPRIVHRWTWKLIQRWMGLPAGLAPGAELDAALDDVYARHLLGSALVDRFVLLAFDHYHTGEGRRTPPPRRRSDRGSDIYTSNSLVRDACARHPQRYLFGASIHPYRDNAVACLDEVFEAGACLLKWLPLHQNIDVSDPRARAVMRRCAELGLPLLVHYNEEFSLATQHPELRPIGPLLEALRALRAKGRMPLTIAAHVATPVSPLGDWRSHEELLAALTGEFADAPLYADISALTSWGKIAFLRRMARRQELHGKLLFGTDFPVPLGLPRLRWDLGARAYREIRALPSWPDQTLRIVREMGFNEITQRRAAGLLPNLTRFSSAGPESGKATTP